MKTLSNELMAAIRPLEIKLKLLWIGVFPSFGVYMFLAWRMSQRETAIATSASQMLPIAITLGLMVLAQSFVYRWFTLSSRAIVNMLTGKQPVWLKRMANPDAPQSRAGLEQEYLDLLEGDERRLYEYSGCLFSIIIVQWGLVNTCALFGMILPPVQYQPLAAVVAGVLSAAGMLFHYPGIRGAFAAGMELAAFERDMRRD